MNNIAGLLLCGLLAGCSSTPIYDAKFGDAVREARLRMTMNPDAGNSEDIVVGMDGKSAKEAVTRYQNSFKEPPPVTNVINIGGTITKGK